MVSLLAGIEVEGIMQLRPKKLAFIGNIQGKRSITNIKMEFHQINKMKTPSLLVDLS